MQYCSSEDKKRCPSEAGTGEAGTGEAGTGEAGIGEVCVVVSKFVGKWYIIGN